MKDIIKKIKNYPTILNTVKYFISRSRHISSLFKWRALQKSNEIKLDLGSGPKKGKNGWTTVDMGSSLIPPDISWDLRRGIPLKNNSVQSIYSSHLLEHIPYNQLVIFLKECRRVMKTDGEFTVCVPNFRLYADAYMKKVNFIPRENWWRPGSVDTNSSMDQINYMVYMKDEHKYMFDEENLVNTLYQAGFSNVNLRDFDPSLDMQERDFESIYALAIK